MILKEWQVKTPNLQTVNYTAEFKKLLSHLKTIFGCSKEQIANTSFYVDLAFGVNRHSLEIKYNEEQNIFIILIKDRQTKQILLDIAHVDWHTVLLTLQKKGYIRDTKLCEQISTIDEFRLYKNLWDDTLLEWKDSKGNTVKLNNTSSQVTSKNINNNSSEKVVYAWDIYLDPRDKGTFCSAEKYNGVWDGMVYETEAKAEDAAWYHLLELEDEGELSPDPNIYVEPSDYNIDIIAIPLSEIPEAVLEYSYLDHLIP